MHEFWAYVDTLNSLAYEIAPTPRTTALLHSLAQGALDGEASREVRQLISINEARSWGIFFSNQVIATKVAELARAAISSCDEPILDPTCGTGDLLLACLPFIDGRDFSTRLRKAGERLRGIDIHPSLVEAARLRVLIALLAAHPRTRIDPRIITGSFPNICSGDALNVSAQINEASCLIVNPPFYKMIAPLGCIWGGGKVTAAAVMLHNWVTQARPGTVITGVLPEVLRSGTFYERWRSEIASRAALDYIEIVGRFDSNVDIDVFLFRLVIRKKAALAIDTKWYDEDLFGNNFPKLGDLFEIKVGPFIPHRHGRKGPWINFVEAKGLPQWVATAPVHHKRRFSGKATMPPFLVIRRNSRPEDKYRAIATVITGNEPVVVENHLIILKPNNEGVDRCLKALKWLKNKYVNEWFNRRIRCRHLTVSALKSLPVFTGNTT